MKRSPCMVSESFGNRRIPLSTPLEQLHLVATAQNMPKEFVPWAGSDQFILDPATPCAFHGETMPQ